MPERSSTSAPATKASRTSALSPMMVQQWSVMGEPAPATGESAADLGRPPAETAVAAGHLLALRTIPPEVEVLQSLRQSQEVPESLSCRAHL